MTIAEHKLSTQQSALNVIMGSSSSKPSSHVPSSQHFLSTREKSEDSTSSSTSTPDHSKPPPPDISSPLQKRSEITHLSALIDPIELAKSGSMARSPSGNLLGSLGLLDRSDRPLCVRERQDSIRAAMESTPDLRSYAEVDANVDHGHSIRLKDQKRKSSWCLRRFGSK